jgi:hypothetical protein
MRFRKLQWLFPLVVALHNTEEAIWLRAEAVLAAGAAPGDADNPHDEVLEKVELPELQNSGNAAVEDNHSAF